MPERVVHPVLPAVADAIDLTVEISGPTGSGDRLQNWLTALVRAAVALGIGGIWAAADRKRRPELFALWTTPLRYGLAYFMLAYGFIKLFPLQMPDAPRM